MRGAYGQRYVMQLGRMFEGACWVGNVVQESIDETYHASWEWCVGLGSGWV